MAERDIGVPGALAEALGVLRRRIPAERLDRVWIFPPLVDGRSESGVVAAGCFGGGSRRLLVTVSYRARESGRGVRFTPVFAEQGTAPAESLPRVIAGVARRAGPGFGDPSLSRLGGDPRALDRLVGEWTPDDLPHRAGRGVFGRPAAPAPAGTGGDGE